jgi:hypothetical protein
MGIYRKLYDFAAKTGSLEGYAYPKEMDPNSLTPWVDHMVEEYRDLPPDVKKDFQDLCDFTVGRTIQSLLPHLGEDHEIIKKLKSITVGKLPSSYDEFPDRRK